MEAAEVAEAEAEAAEAEDKEAEKEEGREEEEDTHDEIFERCEGPPDGGLTHAHFSRIVLQQAGQHARCTPASLRLCVNQARDEVRGALCVCACSRARAEVCSVFASTPCDLRKIPCAFSHPGCL